MARPKGKLSAAAAAKAAEQGAGTSSAAITVSTNPDTAAAAAMATEGGSTESVAPVQQSQDSEKPKANTKTRGKSPAVENIVSGTGITIDNCTHFQNEHGRIFAATEVLRRMARRQNLQPVMAPKQ